MKIKKYILYTIVLIAVIVTLGMTEFLIKAYYNPREKNFYLSTKGCLVYDLAESDYEIIETEVVGENLDYLFNNKNDVIQGNILVNGFSIFSQKEVYYDSKSSFDYDNGFFYSEFYDNSIYTSIGIGNKESICKIIATSKSWDMLVCCIVIDENVDDKVKQVIKKDALLVIPADNLIKAKELIDKATSNSTHMDDWLKERGGFYTNKKGDSNIN
ncbi:hypothetical protein [Thomasclavelia cocleata]|uniref:hypothetical protein n=1 Tax=Thomasclavelia cocleata TaxID=69824 RepID=UPI0024306C7E|nr:hypothetical protein [Thomasclavelia cocleata]